MSTVFFQRCRPWFGRRWHSLIFQNSKPSGNIVLWSPHKEQLSGAFMGNLKTSPCLERYPEEPVYLPVLYSVVLGCSIYYGAFLLWKSGSMKNSWNFSGVNQIFFISSNLLPLFFPLAVSCAHGCQGKEGEKNMENGSGVSSSLIPGNKCSVRLENSQQKSMSLLLPVPGIKGDILLSNALLPLLPVQREPLKS